jgi:hypothetical protein
MLVGGRYRSTYSWKVPYSDTLAGAMVGAIDAAGSVLQLAGVHVQQVSVQKPADVQQTAGGRYTRWTVQVVWTWKGANTGGGATY